MHWFFTGLLIAACVGTVAFGGLLLRRLFTTEPSAPDADATSPATLTAHVPVATPEAERTA